MRNSIACQKLAVVMAAALILVWLNTKQNVFAHITFPQAPVAAICSRLDAAELRWGRDVHPCEPRGDL